MNTVRTRKFISSGFSKMNFDVVSYRRSVAQLDLIKYLLVFILLTNTCFSISRMKVKVKVSRAIKRGRTIWLTYLMSVAFFCFLSSTLYPSYQQQGVTNYQTLFIMSKCIYTALVGEEMPQSSDQITWDENMHQG